MATIKEMKIVQPLQVGNAEITIVSQQPAQDELERMLRYSVKGRAMGSIPYTISISPQGFRINHGSFTPSIWEATNGTGDRTHEIKISAEHLARPWIEIFHTVHDLSFHAENWTKGIQDTSGNVKQRWNGKYQNSYHKQVGERNGMEYPEGKTKSAGWGTGQLTKEYSAQVIAELKPADGAFQLVRLKLESKPRKSTPKNRKWGCDCMKIWASYATEIKAKCEHCGKYFLLVEAEEVITE